MQSDRERFRAIMAYEAADRIPVYYFGTWREFKRFIIEVGTWEADPAALRNRFGTRLPDAMGMRGGLSVPEAELSVRGCPGADVHRLAQHLRVGPCS